jgi:hypothetical protein
VVLSENDTDKNRSYFTWLGSEMVSFFVKNDIYFCGKGILLTGKMKKKTHGS